MKFGQWAGETTVKVLDQKKAALIVSLRSIIIIIIIRMDRQHITEQKTNQLTYNNALPLREKATMG